MHCEKCGNNNLHIVDSRHYDNGTRRRRECSKCRYRFTTHELSVERMDSLETDGNKWRRLQKYLARLNSNAEA